MGLARSERPHRGRTVAEVGTSTVRDVCAKKARLIRVRRQFADRSEALGRHGFAFELSPM